ncbi:YvrJ family protein [Jeotgalicoccus meleagridis]|uniref:YvrJ family protein n=1 Tax=Jeotgalicoccus meleagridis TaxID=2759181 RepID=UPI002E2CD077|nr:YvrJ family protein [Jeotgalicoccus meleagridis]
MFYVQVRASRFPCIQLKSSIQTQLFLYKMDWLPFVSEVGLPAVITIFLLHRMESKLDDLIITIQQLK